jgi:hypothetical protein
MSSERRAAFRVPFQEGYPAKIVAVDGSWQRPCFALDISQSGAKLDVDGTLGLGPSDEFFLVLSNFGTAHRKCRKVWLNGSLVGVNFLTKNRRKKRSQPAGVGPTP